MRNKKNTEEWTNKQDKIIHRKDSRRNSCDTSEDEQLRKGTIHPNEDVALTSVPVEIPVAMTTTVAPSSNCTWGGMNTFGNWFHVSTQRKKIRSLIQKSWDKMVLHPVPEPRVELSCQTSTQEQLGLSEGPLERHHYLLLMNLSACVVFRTLHDEVAHDALTMHLWTQSCE